MTCIVGIEHKGSVILGADSAGVSTNIITPRADIKVFFSECKEYVFGFTSSFRMGQILQHVFTPPVRQPNVPDDFAFLVGYFIPTLMNCMTENGYAAVNNNRVSGGTFMMGYRSKLYTIDNDYQVGRSLLGYDAVGCGQEYALGAIHAGANNIKEPKRLLTVALDAASTFSTGVCGPYNFVTLKASK
jgi:ATP-dependent protease HslVU (ClpYQ) peptidase subunit